MVTLLDSIKNGIQNQLFSFPQCIKFVILHSILNYNPTDQQRKYNKCINLIFIIKNKNLIRKKKSLIIEKRKQLT